MQHVKGCASPIIYTLRDSVNKMSLSICTNSGTTYTYIRHSNEIAQGVVKEELRELSFNKRHVISNFPELSVFTLGITTKCNLRCSYCCYSGSYRNTRTHGQYSMSSKDIAPIIEFIKRYARKIPITISFYGGESLLEFDMLDEFVRKAKSEWHNDVKFEVSTNGTLLSPHIVDWLIANDITLFLSLDGAERVQNRQRKTSSGLGSFKQIIDALHYIKSVSCEYFQNKVNIMMTVVDVSEMPIIATEWYDDELLRNKLPLRISTVAPNYAKGVQKVDVDQSTALYLSLLDAYEQHPEHSLMKVFFERFLAEWMDRPIFGINSSLDFPTCVPNNQKLYIDSYGEVGICEKVPDKYRIGDVKNGIDWKLVNRQADDLSRIILYRCAKCPIARLCSICPEVLDLSKDELDVFCHNERAMQQVKLRIFCEMAERGLI